MDFFDNPKNNHLIILIISILVNIALIIGICFITYKYQNYACECEDDLALDLEPVLPNVEEENKEEKDIYVEVKGAVKTPGVYLVKENNIINDVINKAGGFNKDAYSDNINLSHRVTNELVIYVYTKDEYNKKTETPNSNSLCQCPTYDITDCKEKNESIIIPTEEEDKEENNSTTSTNDNNTTNDKVQDEGQETNKLVNINTASLSELMTLSGIGESKAQDIINYRNKNGPFKSIEDIKKVNGIKDGTFNKIKDRITV